jgi:hypothetical protein
LVKTGGMETAFTAGWSFRRRCDFHVARRFTSKPAGGAAIIVGQDYARTAISP